MANGKIPGSMTDGKKDQKKLSGMCFGIENRVKYGCHAIKTTVCFNTITIYSFIKLFKISNFSETGSSLLKSRWDMVVLEDGWKANTTGKKKRKKE